MNRYNFSKAEIKRALSGNNVPNFMTRYAFKAKGGKLYFEGREVIPNEERENYLRKILYDKESDLPLARDSLFYLLQKRVINISKRFIESFLKKQKVIVNRTARPRQEKRKLVRHIKKAGSVSADLVHIEPNDLPSGYMPDPEQEDMAAYNPADDDKKNKPKWGKVKKTYYMYNMVDKLTSYLVTEIVPSKEEDIIWKATQKLLTRMASALSTPVKVYSIDKGTEFNLSAKKLKALKGNKSVTVMRMRTNALVENVNSTLQRIFYTIVKQRRSIKKAVEIHNNTFNRKVGMTPNEAVEKLLAGDTLKRRDGKHPKKILKKNAYKVGTLVRALKVDRAKVKPGFKTYKGKHYGQVQTITRVVFYQGYPRYELDNKKRTVESVPNPKDKKKKKPKGRSMMKWHDQLTLAKNVDQKSEKLISDRPVVKWVSPAFRPKYKVGDLVLFTYFGNEYKAKLITKIGNKWGLIFKLNPPQISEAEADEDEIKPR